MTSTRQLMTSEVVLRHRLQNQQLVGSRFRTPAEIVQWLGAMQAQEYAMVKWAIGLRLHGATDQSIEQAINAGEILRTHVLRPTWHLVAPADLRWMLALTAPRVRAALAYNDRQFDVNARVLRRSHAIFEKLLAGGRHLTRDELAEELNKNGVVAQGTRLAHLVIHAELDGLVCSGPRRGRKGTYALLEERVRSTSPKSRSEALAELAHRYFSSRGPATVPDFAWWSGLTLSEAQSAAESLGSEYSREVVSGKLHLWSQTNPGTSQTATTATFLLPDYDEYGIAYKDRTALTRKRRASAPATTLPTLAYNRMVILDGFLVGSWRRKEEKGALALEIAFNEQVGTSGLRALKRAIERYSAFLGKPVEWINAPTRTSRK